MSYEGVMTLQWRMLEARDPHALLEDPGTPADVRDPVAAGMTYGWRIDRVRREARLVGVLRQILPASSVAYVASGDDAVRAFMGSAHFQRRAREVGSTYPPVHATARAFVEFVRSGGWAPRQWWPECLAFEAGLAIPSEATFPSGRTTPGGAYALGTDDWTAAAGHDFEAYAGNLARGLTQKPWRLAVQVHHPQVKDILVLNRIAEGRVRRVKLSGPLASAVWSVLDPGRPVRPGSGSPVDPGTALDRLVDGGFLRRAGS